jgi:4-hydroxy-tetrahydrodipicolinate reductase
VRLALIGRGRMGGEVARLARAAGHEIALELGSADNAGGSALSRERLAGVDVAIELTRPEAVVENVRRVAAAGKPIVVGTTGWDARLDEVRAIVEAAGTGMVYGANFSVGVQITLRLVALLAQMADRFPEYDPFVFEHHHRGKADAPSGTALRLGETLLAGIGHKTRLETSHGGTPIAPEAISVASVRAGAAFGHHEVGLDGPADQIRVVHTARGREGFARGALLAAAWVRGRRGVHEFTSVLEEGGQA